MTRDEVDRLREDLIQRSVPHVTPVQEHEQALIAYLSAVVEFIDERTTHGQGAASVQEVH